MRFALQPSKFFNYPPERPKKHILNSYIFLINHSFVKYVFCSLIPLQHRGLLAALRRVDGVMIAASNSSPLIALTACTPSLGQFICRLLNA